MSTPYKQYVLHKYLPAGGGRIEINITAKTAHDYEIDRVFFFAQHGPVVVKEELTFFMLAMRIWESGTLSDRLDEWIAALLPQEMKKDTFAEDADKAYEVAGWNGIGHLL